jgi:hypothetical protein
MSDEPSAASSRIWARLRDYWWAFGVLAFVAGALVTSFTKYAAWYADEQSRSSAVQSLSVNSNLVLDRLKVLDQAIIEQKYLNAAEDTLNRSVADHLHALDGRADADRDAIAQIREQLATETARTLMLMQRQGSTP